MFMKEWDGIKKKKKQSSLFETGLIPLIEKLFAVMEKGTILLGNIIYDQNIVRLTTSGGRWVGDRRAVISTVAAVSSDWHHLSGDRASSY